MRRRERPGIRIGLALVVAVAGALVAPVASSGAADGPAAWSVPGVRIEPLDPGGELDVAGLGGYRGSIELQAGGGGMTIVNRVGLDDYVRGIAEMPADWPAAALQAQAIAARTYALWELRAGKPLCATDACQVYAGLTKERSDPGGWAAAVAATRDQILLWRGAPILAMYSSSNGGQMVAGSQPYLRSGRDPDDAAAPVHVWQSSVSLDALRSLFSVPAPVTGVARTNHDTVALSWTAGTTTTTAPAASPSSTTSTTSAASTPPPPASSSNGTSGEPPTTVPPTESTTTTAPSSSSTTTPVPTSQPSPSTTSSTAPASDPTTGQVEVATDAFVQRLNSTQPAPEGLPRILPSPRFEVRVDQATSAAVFDGKGFGHGIGMSQYGALGKARRGLKAADILAAYYGGIRPSAAPAGSLPAVIPVTLDEARSTAAVSSPSRFRVVAADGAVLAVAASGEWRFSVAGGQVRVTPPPDQQGPMKIVPIGARLSGEPSTGGTVEVAVSLSLPAVVHATVVAVQPPPPPPAQDPGTTPVPLPPATAVPDAGTSAAPAAAPPPPPAPPPAPPPPAGATTTAPTGPGDTRMAIPVTAVSAAPAWVVHLEADAGGGRVAAVDLPIELVRATPRHGASGGVESSLGRLTGSAVRRHPVRLLLLALGTLLLAAGSVAAAALAPRLRAALGRSSPPG